MKVSKIKTIKSYIGTLREFKVGETKYYKLVNTDYTGFYMARKRLQDNKIAQFSFDRHEEGGERYFTITREE